MKKLHKEIDLVLQLYLPDDYFEDLRKKLIPRLAQLIESKHLHKPVVSGKRPIIEGLLIDYKMYDESTESTVDKILAACDGGEVDKTVSDVFKDCTGGYNLKCKCEGECDYNTPKPCA